MRAAVKTAFSRYTHDRVYRGNIGIYLSMALNFGYAALNLTGGLAASSLWLGACGCYFLFLGLIRAVLAYAYKTKDVRGGFKFEQGLYKVTAWLLFALSIPMGYMIILLIKTETKTVYPWYTIYASAAYTFYLLTVSVINLVRFRKLGSPILSASKVISFVSSLMSLLVLQNALISEFSDGGSYYREMMNTYTGIGVYALVIAVAVYMVFHSVNLFGDEENEQISKQIF